MAGKSTKAAKKFGAKRALSGVLKQRKKVALITKRFAPKTKSSNSNSHSRNENGSTDQQRTFDLSKIDIATLDVDELLNGDYFSTEATAEDNNSNDEQQSDEEQQQSADEDDEEEEDVQEAEDDEEAEEEEEEEGNSSADDVPTAAAGSDDDDSEMNDSDVDVEEETKKLQAEIASMKQGMDGLAQSDPAFRSFLEKESKELLSFDAKATAEEESEAEDEEEDEDEAAAAATSKRSAESREDHISTLTPNAFKIIRTAILKHNSVKACKQLARVFRSACHLNDDKLSGEQDDSISKASQHNNSIVVTSSRLYDDVMRFTFKNLAVVITTLLPVNTNSKKQLLTNEDKLGINGVVIKSLLTNAVHYITHISALVNDNLMLRFCLSCINNSNNNNSNSCIPFMQPFMKLTHKFIKLLLTIWSSADHHTRIDAFLTVRGICLQLPSETQVLSLVLKSMYLTYVKHCKFTTAQTLPIIVFMSQCVVEVYGIDYSHSYQHAFVYVRQLAIHLRQAIQSKTADAHKSVYNWQFVNCLRVWCSLLQSHATLKHKALDSSLRPLLYPLIQIALSTLSLLPPQSTRYLPLRLIVSQFLLLLSAATHTFIPLAASLLSVFASSELHKKPSKSTKKLPDLRYVLHVSSNVQSTKIYQEQITTAVLTTLQQYMTTYSYSIAYPELLMPVLLYLRRFAKRTRIVRIAKQIAALVLKLEANALWVQHKRSMVDYAPKDMQQRNVSVLLTFKSNSNNNNEKSPLDKLSSNHNMNAQQQAISNSNSKSASDKSADWTGKNKARNERVDDSDNESGSEDDDAEEEEDNSNSDSGSDEDDDGEQSDDAESEDDERPAQKRAKHDNSSNKKPAAKPQQQQQAQKQQQQQQQPKKQQQQQQKKASTRVGTEDIVKNFTLSDVDNSDDE